MPEVPFTPVTVPRAIQVRGLSHRMGSGAAARQVLFDLDLEVGWGELVILMGPSGCGKTTILTLVGALRSVQAGSVQTLGVELAGASQATRIALRRRIGFIYQAHNLHASLTACGNVRMGLEVHGIDRLQEAEDQITAILRDVGLADYGRSYPARLSVGQKQRVAIARALVACPPLILADEPTSALDRTTGRQVVDLLQDLTRRQGSTILMVTHDNRILDIADRIIEMEDGRILSSTVPKT
ncbi:ATP-binding cassette domain-containing protein [Gloeobacter kilaueensis]|uniref:ABC transporter, ATP-binding protein n=1 Tax=Gloeobacter kilaueensis (strain ATCC BAA-2537 / CCAP 1431/1 / ULC 316 / JS1) TaxID=1183438 RepID=U5QC70_GLOK1|nr:ATP-binding cassette domain-containing protein [Gloeobacter kilaueensis]AGY56418.1 ABC transporter, ATP-binding protein [Gloeobacter kilaueensis JS1]